MRDGEYIFRARKKKVKNKPTPKAVLDTITRSDVPDSESASFVVQNELGCIPQAQLQDECWILSALIILKALRRIPELSMGDIADALPLKSEEDIEKSLERVATPDDTENSLTKTRSLRSQKEKPDPRTPGTPMAHKSHVSFFDGDDSFFERLDKELKEANVKKLGEPNIRDMIREEEFAFRRCTSYLWNVLVCRRKDILSRKCVQFLLAKILGSAIFRYNHHKHYEERQTTVNFGDAIVFLKSLNQLMGFPKIFYEAITPRREFQKSPFEVIPSDLHDQCVIARVNLTGEKNDTHFITRLKIEGSKVWINTANGEVFYEKDLVYNQKAIKFLGTEAINKTYIEDIIPITTSPPKAAAETERATEETEMRIRPEVLPSPSSVPPLPSSPPPSPPPLLVRRRRGAVSTSTSHISA